MRSLHSYIAICAALLLGLCLADTTRLKAGTPNALTYTRGARLLTTHGLYVHGTGTSRDIDIFDARTGYGYYPFDGLGLYVDLHATGYSGARRGRQVRTGGVGAAYLVRWHFIRRAACSAFLDYGYGALLTAEDFPPGGTPINASRQYSLGLTLRLRPGLDLILAYRHLHISNGTGLHAGNPSFDGNGFYTGYVFPF